MGWVVVPDDTPLMLRGKSKRNVDTRRLKLKYINARPITWHCRTHHPSPKSVNLLALAYMPGMIYV